MHDLAQFVAEEVIGRLTSLRVLVICESEELISLTEGIGKIARLQLLEVHNCQKLASLPSGIRHLTALKELKVHDCDNLVMLSNSFTNLTSLGRVEIEGCPKLMSLPEGIDRVPVVKIDGMNFEEFNQMHFVDLPGVLMQDQENQKDVQ